MQSTTLQMNKNHLVSQALLQFDINTLLNAYSQSLYIPSIRTFTPSTPNLILLQDPLFLIVSNKIDVGPLLFLTSIQPTTPNQLISHLNKDCLHYELLYNLGQLLLYCQLYFQDKDYKMKDYDQCNQTWKDIYTFRNLRLYHVYSHSIKNQESVLQVNLHIVEILEVIRLQHSRDSKDLAKHLITCYFTIQEYVEYTLYHCQVAWMNTRWMTKYALQLPGSWFTLSFIQSLIRLLSFIPPERSSLDASLIQDAENVFELLYFASKRSNEFKIDLSSHTIQVLEGIIHHSRAPCVYATLLLQSMLVRDTLNDHHQETFHSLISVCMTKYAPLFFRNVYAQSESSIFIIQSTNSIFTTFCNSILHGYENYSLQNTCQDFYSILLVFKRCKALALEQLRSQWLVFSPPVKKKYQECMKWSLSSMNESFQSHQSISFLVSLAAFSGLKGIMNMNDGRTTLLLCNQSAQLSLLNPQMNQALVLILSDLLLPLSTQDVTILDTEFINTWMILLKKTIYVLFVDTFTSSFIGKNDELSNALLERQDSILYSNANKIAKCASLLMGLSSLNNTLFSDSYSIFTILSDFSHELHSNCMESGFYIDAGDHQDLWKHLKNIGFSTTLILKSIHWCFDDRDIPVSTSMYGILMDLHFIILEFGSHGFSLWRDSIDKLLLSFHSRPVLLEKITRHYLQLASSKSMTRTVFIMNMISYSLQDFSISFLEWALLSHCLPLVKELMIYKIHYRHRKQVMAASLETLLANLCEKTRYSLIIKKIWPYFLQVLLHDAPLEPAFATNMIYSLAESLCQSHHDAMSFVEESEWYQEIDTMIEEIFKKTNTDNSNGLEYSRILVSLVEVVPSPISLKIQEYILKTFNVKDQKQMLLQVLSKSPKMNYETRVSVMTRFMPLFNDLV